jgi:hypothetical protein
VIFVLLLTCGQVSGQFTQGPPGNPSAAGISTGSPQPVPVPPPTITPPRAPGAFPNVGASPSIPVEKEVAFFAAMLGLEGIPPVLSAYPDSSLSRYLKLSSDQLERIETLRNGLYRETRDLRYDLLKKRLDMSRLFADPSTSGAALISAHKEALSLQIKLADAAARQRSRRGDS